MLFSVFSIAKVYGTVAGHLKSSRGLHGSTLKSLNDTHKLHVGSCSIGVDDRSVFLLTEQARHERIRVVFYRFFVTTVFEFFIS